jgi:hypothetical protein
MAVNKKAAPVSNAAETGVFGKLLAVIGDSINGNKVEAPKTVDERVKVGVNDYVGKLKDGTQQPHLDSRLQKSFF